MRLESAKSRSIGFGLWAICAVCLLSGDARGESVRVVAGKKSPPGQQIIVLLYGDKRVEHTAVDSPPVRQPAFSTSDLTSENPPHPPATGTLRLPRTDRPSAPPESRTKRPATESIPLRIDLGVIGGAPEESQSVAASQDDLRANRSADTNDDANRARSSASHVKALSESRRLPTPSDPARLHVAGPPSDRPFPPDVAQATGESAPSVPGAEGAAVIDRPEFTATHREPPFPASSHVLAGEPFRRADEAKGIRGSTDAEPLRASHSADSSGWVTTSIVQVAGTVIGFLLGLLVAALVTLALIRFIGWERIGPLVRVEILRSSPPASQGLRLFPASEDEQEAGPRHSKDREAPVSTPVLDFGAAAVPFQTAVTTYDEQQRAKAEDSQRRDKQIVQQIFESNMQFRAQTTSGARAA